MLDGKYGARVKVVPTGLHWIQWILIRLLLLMAMGGFVSAAVAQTANPQQDQNIPYGSPVGAAQSSDRQSSSRDDERTSTTPQANTTDERIEAVDINGSEQETLTNADRELRATARDVLDRAAKERQRPLVPSEFEKYVENRLGRPLPRFGASLLLPGNGDYALPATATVPPDYILNVGDTVSIALTGSIEGSVDVRINTDGNIFLSRVGQVRLAGVAYRDLRDTVSAAVGRQYRGYTVTVGVRQLRGIRVYVTGYANNPGAYSVNSLSTMVNALLAAGGPSSGGSFRSAKLYRNGQLISDFDLYDLLLRGDRTRDSVLQNEDILYIEPLGAQIAVAGSVNAEAVYEAKPGDNIQQLLAYAGGLADLADTSRVMLYRLSDLAAISGREVARAETASVGVEGGDILSVLSQGSIQRPVERQAVLVRIEGEVQRPGNYFVKPNTSLDEVLAQAGGLTVQAFPFGTRVERLSVRQQQRESFREAVEQVEISLAASPLTSSTLDAGERTAQIAAAQQVVARLRAAEPDGRIVLDLPFEAASLPGNLLLENSDRIVVPPRPVTVGVFGAVYRPASFLINADVKPLKVRDYIERAGGGLRAADRGAVFVVRANGSVISKRNGALGAAALPGDVIFVPVRTQSNSLLSRLREISQVIFQFGLGAAAFVAVAK